jgi:hypothetical protein
VVGEFILFCAEGSCAEGNWYGDGVELRKFPFSIGLTTVHEVVGDEAAYVPSLGVPLLGTAAVPPDAILGLEPAA